MGGHPTWYLAAIVLMALSTVAVAARQVPRTRSQRAAARHLQEVGLVATGRISAVEPIQRSVNAAAGHPVTVTFQDSTGYQRQVRDISGLDGYLLREGTQVTVRYSPTDPGHARVEEAVGPHGAYPLRSTGRGAAPSWLPALVTLAGTLLMLPVVLILELTDGNLAFQLIPPLFGVVGLIVLTGSVVHLVRTRHERRAPRDETVGVVTEVWSSMLRGKRSTTQVYPFTVHFTTRDGREVHTRYPVATSGFRPQPPQQVRVRYDQTRPTRFEVAELRTADLLLRPVPFVLGVIFLAVGVVWTAANVTLG